MRYKLWKPEAESEISESFAELRYGDMIVEIPYTAIGRISGWILMGYSKNDYSGADLFENTLLLFRYLEEAMGKDSAKEKNMTSTKTELKWDILPESTEQNSCEEELRLYKEFFKAWNRCDSNRGCYSCCDEHDCRCNIRIGESCNCGRDQLIHAESEIVKMIDSKD